MSETAKEDDAFDFLYRIKTLPLASPESPRDHVSRFAVATIPDKFDADEFRYICACVYAAWVDLKRLPDPVDVARYGANVARVREVMKHPSFTAAMQAQGVPFQETGGLTAEQLLLMQILTNPTDKRDLKAKLKQAGVTYLQYRAWMRQEVFASYMMRTAEGMLTDHIPDFNTVLTQKALAGDLNALRYANELSGRHDPNRQQVLDLQVIVSRLLDIITRNVTDTETLTRISNEFALVMGSTQSGPPAIRGEIGVNHNN